uniref:Uncharacterized protein n=1 Tax=Cacopsylla melanoneura TaxID=428564 RepID=A0A8D8ZQ23_9HEMI
MDKAELEDVLNKFMGDLRGTIRNDMKEEMKEQLTPIANQINNLNLRATTQDNKIQLIEEKVDDKFDTEDRKRNILIFNMQEKDNETIELLESMVIEMIVNIMKVNCTTYHIDYISRIGKNTNGKRPILVKFTTHKMKIQIWKNRRNLKGQEYRIDQDYNQETRKKRKALVPKVKELREQGVKASIHRDHIVTWNNDQDEAPGSQQGFQSQQTPHTHNKKRSHSITPEGGQTRYTATPKRFQTASRPSARVFSQKPDLSTYKTNDGTTHSNTQQNEENILTMEEEEILNVGTQGAPVPTQPDDTNQTNAGAPGLLSKQSIQA